MQTRPSPIKMSPFISIPDLKKRFGLWGNAVLLCVANITQEREILGGNYFCLNIFLLYVDVI